jgi:hypothetical protein
MFGLVAMTSALMADTSSAGAVVHAYVAPVVQSLGVAASLVCVFFLVTGGFHYMTSAGKPDNLEHAKRVIRNALIGLVIVLAAGALTVILTHAYASSPAAINGKLPALASIQPQPVSNGLVDVLIKAITGLLNNIIQSVAAPFLKALTFFTNGTPLMAENPGVFNLWLALVGMADALFVFVVALLGFHVMSAASFGIDEIEFKHLLPRLAGIFLLVNTSIFAIDGVIELSNAMIKAIHVGLPTTSVWDVLTAVVRQSGGLGVAALLLMIAFLIFAVILLVYYVGRLVTLYIGAVLAPVVLLLWLMPGFRDFSESAAKIYVTTVFVLFVHVVILTLAATLFTGLLIGSPAQAGQDTLMALVVGLATVIALLKTQGVMMQLSYVSIGPRTARKLGGQFINGVSYATGRGKAVAGVASSRRTNTNMATTKNRTGSSKTAYTQPKTKPGAPRTSPRAAATTRTKTKRSDLKTGTTMPAPRVTDNLKDKEKQP